MKGLTKQAAGPQPIADLAGLDLDSDPEEEEAVLTTGGSRPSSPLRGEEKEEDPSAMDTELIRISEKLETVEDEDELNQLLSLAEGQDPSTELEPRRRRLSHTAETKVKIEPRLTTGGKSCRI